MVGKIIELRAKGATSPSTKKGKVMPVRRQNKDYRSREHLTVAEVEALRRAARKTRYPARDEALVLMGFRHGLRVQELVSLRWDALDLNTRQLHVERLKRGRPGTQMLQGDTIRLLRRVLRDQQESGRPSAFVFASERGSGSITATLKSGTVVREVGMTPANFRMLLKRLGTAAKLSIKVHPHMLRHACGYELVNRNKNQRRIQQHLGHTSIQSTEVYTALAAQPDIWRD
jgi:integrase